MTTVIISNNTTGSYIGDFPGANNTYLDSLNITTNRQASSNQAFYDWSSTERYNNLFSFSGISNITGPVSVSNATLNIACKASGSGVVSADFYKLLVPWVSTQATWSNRVTGTAWAGAGATGSGTDRATTKTLDTVTIPVTVNAWGNYSSAQLAADCEGDINGTTTHNGWVGDSSTTGTYAYVYPEWDTTGYAAALAITYTAGGTPVSNSLTTEYEALAGVTQQSISQFEHLQHAANTAQINFESKGSVLITSSAVIAYEALQGVPSSKILSIESLAAIAGQVQAQIEAGQRVAKSYTLQLEGKGYVSQTAANRIEVMTYLSASALSQFESLQIVSGNASLNVEALRLIANATGISFEALLGANVTVVINTVTRTAHFAIMLEKTATFGDTLNKTATFGDVIEKTITFH